VLGWCAATLSSIALASVAMLPVLRTAAPDEGALVSVDRISGAAPAQPTSLPPVPSVPATSRPVTPPRSPTAAVTSSPVPPFAGRSPSPPPRTRATTTPAGPSTTTVEDGWTVTTTADGEKSYVRSFRVEGGQTVIRMTPGNVRLVTATPNEGFSVATVQNEPDNLAVYFNEVNHSFIIHAVWRVDRPFVEVSEIGN
jgi:hypothetical protein